MTSKARRLDGEAALALSRPSEIVSTTKLEDIPDELLALIIKLAGPDLRAFIRGVSRHFRELVDTNRDLFDRRTPLWTISPPKVFGWRSPRKATLYEMNRLTRDDLSRLKPEEQNLYREHVLSSGNPKLTTRVITQTPALYDMYKDDVTTELDEDDLLKYGYPKLVVDKVKRVRFDQPRWYTILVKLAMFGRLDVINEIFANDVRSSVPMGDIAAAVEGAIAGGHLQVLKRVLERSAEISKNAAYVFNAPALERALSVGNIPVLEFITTFESGVNVYHPERMGIPRDADEAVYKWVEKKRASQGLTSLNYGQLAGRWHSPEMVTYALSHASGNAEPTAEDLSLYANVMSGLGATHDTIYIMKVVMSSWTGQFGAATFPWQHPVEPDENMMVFPAFRLTVVASAMFNDNKGNVSWMLAHGCPNNDGVALFWASQNGLMYQGGNNALDDEMKDFIAAEHLT
jgi:hypothetical protein